MWDAGSGREALVLKGHTGLVTSVAFSPDGMRLASAGFDQTVRVWDAREVTPQVRAGWEAACVANTLFDRPLPKNEVIAKVKADRTINDDVRRRVLELAEGRREAESGPLNDAAWAVVRRPGASALEYQRAVAQARVAAQLAPADGAILNTLGVALYRAGDYGQAVKILTRSDQMQGKSPAGPFPHDLAILAMAHCRLGQKEQAEGFLKRLRDAMKQPQWAKDEEAQAFLKEAEALLKGPAKAP